MSIVSNYNRFSPRHKDVHCHGADEGKDGQTAEDRGRHADHARGIVFGTSGAGSVTTALDTESLPEEVRLPLKTSEE